MTQRWIKGAVQHPGALRTKLRHAGLLHGDAALSHGAMDALAKRSKSRGDTTTLKQITLARTLKKLRDGGIAQAKDI